MQICLCIPCEWALPFWILFVKNYLLTALELPSFHDSFQSRGPKTEREVTEAVTALGEGEALTTLSEGEALTVKHLPKQSPLSVRVKPAWQMHL